MNETEKKKLQEAFAIPEPERKNEFIARFRELEQSQRSAPRFPLFMKMASAAAMCAVILGVWVNVRDNARPMNTNNNNIDTAIVTEAEENSENDDTTEKSDDTADITTSLKNAVSKTTSANMTSLSTEKTTKVTATSTSAVSENNNRGTESVSDNKSPSDERDNASENTSSASDNNTTSRHTTKTTAKTTSATQSEKTTTKTTVRTTSSKQTTTKPTTAKPTTTPEITTTMSNAVAPDRPSDQPIDNGKGDTHSKPVDTGVAHSRDLTVNIGERYYPDGNIVDPSEYFNDYPPNTGSDHAPMNISGLYSSSDNVFRGTVTDVIYTNINGDSYVQLNVKLNDCYKGEFAPDDIVSVFYYGGYMTVQQYADLHGISGDYPTDRYINTGNGNYCEVGSEYVFFARSTDPSGMTNIFGNCNDSIYTYNYENCYYGNGNYAFNIYQLIYP